MNSIARLGVRFATSVLAFSLGFAATTALAQQQDGRRTSSNNVDGTSANINGDSFFAPSDGCVVYGILLADATSGPRHVQAGLVRCGVNATPADTCVSGHSYVESWAPTGVDCNGGNNFNNDTSYWAQVKRNSTTSTTVTGQINGAVASGPGFGTTSEIKAYAWGEIAVFGSTCPTGNAVGHFVLWQRWISGTWAPATGSNAYHNNSSACWTVGSTNTSGSFDVS